jgi:uncharacterized protein (TIGR03067 family)
MTATVLSGVLLLAAAAPGPKDPAKAGNPLVGTWAVESLTVAGTAVADFRGTVTFTPDGKYESATAQPGGPQLKSGAYAHDPTKDPPHLDLTRPAEGDSPARTTPATYRVEGDKLTTCAATGSTRPASFDSSAAAGHLVMVLKRVSKKE